MENQNGSGIGTQLNDTQVEQIGGALRQFARDLTATFRYVVPAQPEDQLKGPVGTLVNRVGAAFSLNVSTVTEVQAANVGGRPDLGVLEGGLLSGYIELKAPGVGARPERFRGANKGQWQKFKNLPNLIYTDGSEWSLYRTGTLAQRLRLAGDVTQDGVDAIGELDASKLSRILLDFLHWSPIVPSSPQSLARLLAPLCRLLRDDVRAAAARPDSNVALLAHEWRGRLFPDADDDQFADAYAQTVTYGLLLAQFSGAQELDMNAATGAIEQSHGLLAQAL